MKTISVIGGLLVSVATFSTTAQAAGKVYKSAPLAAVNYAANKMNHTKAVLFIAKGPDGLDRAIHGGDLAAKKLKGAGLRYVVTNKDVWGTSGGNAGANVSLRVTLQKVKGGYQPSAKSRAKVQLSKTSFVD